MLVIFLIFIIFYPKIKHLLSGSNENSNKSNNGGSQTLNVDAMVIKPQILVEQINSSGTLLPDEQVDLSFETSGKIVDINFTEGARVRKGQLLAKINDSHLQAQLLKLQAQKKLAEEREFRQKSLLSHDAISQESYDQAVTELQALHADIMLLEARIAETELRAPFDGIIGLRYVSEGSFANPNSKIARLVKNDPLKIEFSIPERYSGQVQSGFLIKFFLDGLADTLSARVYAIEPAVNINTRTILVRANYSNSNNKIVAGRFVSVQLELSKINDAIAIPTEALIPEMEGDRVFVYRDGVAHSIVVSTGLRTEDKIQITEGLKPGDTLITTGILQLRQTMTVVIDNLF